MYFNVFLQEFEKIKAQRKANFSGSTSLNLDKTFIQWMQIVVHRALLFLNNMFAHQIVISGGVSG